MNNIFMKKMWILVSMLLLVVPASFADITAIQWRSDVPTFNHTREDLTQQWANWHREDNMAAPTAEQFASRVKDSKELQKEFAEGTDYVALTEKFFDTALLLHNGKFQEAYDAGASLKQFGIVIRAHARYLNTYYSVTDKKIRVAEFKAIADEIGTALDKEPENKDLLFIHAYMHGRYLEELPFKMSLVPTYTKLFNGVKDILKENPKHLGAQLIQASFHADASVKAPFLAKVRFGSKPEVALEKFDIALKQDPQSTIAQLEYATALIKLNKGKPDEPAITALKNAATLASTDSNNALAQQKAKHLLAASGNIVAGVQ